MISSEDCYNVYAMKSAMKQVAIGKRIMYREGEIENSVEFSNKDLNAHFHKLFLDLKQEETSGMLGGQGIAIINIWDIGHSHTVYIISFLLCMACYTIAIHGSSLI